ncbi:MAG: sulfatase-like hydrolase/transferase [Proteobacteria bacterium]|nr:sulfatase-like hydrolase/transferase [Pseudomonadota bacterium]
MKVSRIFLGMAASAAFLNVLLTLQNVWPTPLVRVTSEISIEIAVLLCVFVLAAEFHRLPGKSAGRVIAVFLFLLVIGRYADITAPALFGRRIDLYWDARHVPAVAAMIAESAPAWQVMALAGGIVAGLIALFLVIRLAVAGILAAMPVTGLRRGLGAASALAVVLYLGNAAGIHTGTEAAYAAPVMPVYAAQANFLIKANQASDSQPTVMPPSDLARTGGGDVYTIFIESYGAIVHDRPEMRSALAGDYKDLDAVLAKTGWKAVSALVDSPTFGGGSWLAHTTLLTGDWITQQPEYRMFLAVPPETLVDRFRQAGYRTVALFPGIRQEWPEGAAMGFDSVLQAQDIPYRGPRFGWWEIPDQASLEAFHHAEISRGDRKPLFLTYASVMSHMPFGPTPPYQPDWSRLAAATPFDQADADAALAMMPDWQNLAPAYLRAIRYNLQMLGGFVENRAPDDALMVVLGDHQPPAAVSGTDASWAVPVHIFSRNSAILQRFATAGFQTGLTPAPPALMRMDALNHLLLHALDSSPRLAGALRN